MTAQDEVPPLTGGGEMGRHVRETDWSATPLGGFSTWPQSLRSVLSLVLNSKGIAAIYWGREQWLLYNDAYGQALGNRHPWAFGRPMLEVLSDIAPVLGTQVAEVLRTGEGFAIENQSLLMHRHGRDEETVWTYSFSPVQGETGAFAGVLLLATEVTQQKTVEQSGVRARTRLETALKVARLGTFEWHTATGVVELDARARQIFALPSEGQIQDAEMFSRVIGEHVERVQAEATAAVGLDGVFEADQLGRAIDIAYDIVHPTEGRRSLETSGAVVQDANGTRRMLGAVNDVTALKRAETELREQNLLLERRVDERTAERNRIWQVSRDMLLVSDQNGVWLEVNPAWTRVLGWSEAELVGQTSEWLEHPDDRAKTRAEIGRLAEGATTLAFENRFRTREGGYRHLSWTAVPEGDRFYCVARDVTEAKAQEIELAARTVERDRSWRLAQELLVVTSPDGTLEAVNQRWTALLGWTEADLIGSKFVEYTHPDDLEATLAAFAGIFEKPLTKPYVYRFRGRDGSYRWFGWTASFEGERIYAAGRDVTDERAQAEILRRSEGRAATYFDFSNDYLFLVRVDADGAGYFEDMNPACARVMGLIRADVVGHLIGMAVPADSAADIMKYAQSCLDTRQPQTYFATREYQNNRKLFIEGRVAYVERHDHGGGLVLFSGHDVTEQRAMEELLRQSQKMEAVGQLTGGLAHDFNNLLAGISGSLELMQIRMQQGRLPDVDRYVVAAQGAAKRAAALTHRLLAFSRRQTLDPKPTDVNRLALGMHELIQRTVGPGIPVEVVGATNAWSALVDPSQLENALLNLCINARDAMPDGGRITVETANKWLDERAARQHDVPAGQYLSLAVTDTGTGMPPEVIARVFEPFFTTKPIGEGTGLGLSMIYGFAQQSGGQVRIYSEVGQGTTVCIYLPRHYGAVADEETGGAAADLPRSHAGETVLVVDDEPTVRMLVTDVLEDLGYSAIEAGDSAAGLKVLQSDVRIDLLVTDVGLPGGMNGRQMADAGRASRPDLKVLFITGYAENAVLGNGHLAPGMAVLTKPFAIDTMAARIRSMIESGKEHARQP